MLARPVWGEGFASDGVAAVANVRSWEELAEGESFRFFPTLRARGGRPAAELRRRALAPSDEINSEDAAWLQALVDAPETRAGVGDLPTMARFAFLTGLHPAYIWPEAEALREWGATAAWLGEPSRRRRALMPPVVADFLTDALMNEGGRTVCRDASLAGLVPRAILTGLAAAAQRRRAGVETVARWGGERSVTALLKRVFWSRGPA